jgi:hypothetical protein
MSIEAQLSEILDPQAADLGGFESLDLLRERFVAQNLFLELLETPCHHKYSFTRYLLNAAPFGATY